jgi:hypothetical protein
MSIATLANEYAIDDLKVLLFTLELWNPVPPTVYLYTDSVATPLVKKIPYKGGLHIQETLNPYSGMNRQTMESLPGKTFKTLFADFCAEKTRLMEWAITDSKAGVFFCDADICHLAPLPLLPPNTTLALSPHMIRKRDTDRYGLYNAGYLYMNSVQLAREWRELCETSRFFEQACLEDLMTSGTHFFPVQVNYGWWRMYQGEDTAESLQSKWGIKREPEHSGIQVDGQPLQSIHTHFGEKRDPITQMFNYWFLQRLRKLTSVKKTTLLVKHLEKVFPTLR